MLVSGSIKNDFRLPGGTPSKAACFQIYLAVHSVQLVVEGHGEVGGGAGGHVGDKGRLALVDRVVHVDATLADLHVLEARLDAVQAERERRRGSEHRVI